MATIRYTPEHEWVEIDGELATIGITRFAADALGDVVYLELPAPGARLEAGRVFGEIESTKSVSELYAPVDGEVVDVNQSVVDSPDLVNADPEVRGWLIRVRIETVPDGLLDEDAYRALVAE